MALPSVAGTSAQPRSTGPSAALFLATLSRLVGDPYIYGAAGPNAFDCSGLVQWSLEHIGFKNVPRTSEAQWAWVQHIPASALQPGDLIFEQWPGDNAPPGHVAIYTGSGKIEEAPQPGEPVHIVPWSPGSVSAAGGRVVGYGRIPGLSGVGGAVLTSAAGGVGGLLSIPSDITNAFTSAGTALDWLLQPSHWVRIFSGVAGTIMAGSGVFMLTHVGGEAAGMQTVPRAMSLPLGIILVGGGSVLLFVAFHNLPSNVENFPDLIGWLMSNVRGGKPWTKPFKDSGSSSPGISINTGPGPNIPGLPGISGLA